MEDQSPIVPAQEISGQIPVESKAAPIYKNKFFIAFVLVSLLVAFLVGGLTL